MNIANSSLKVQKMRLYQLVGFAEIAMGSLGVKAFIEQGYYKTLILLVTSLLLIGIAWLNYRNRQQLAASLFVLVLTVMLLSIMWTSGGIKDNALVALPGLLVFSVMIGVQSIFGYLLAFISLNLLAMGYMFDQGWVDFYAPLSGMSGSINVIIILSIVAVAIRILSQDNQKLIRKLRDQYLEIQKAKRSVEHQVEHDYLTGLPNRILAEKKFEEVISRIRRHPGTKAGIFFIDLDEFKDINDTVGHSVADAFLIKKSNYLVSTLRNTDVMCRVSGDEFMVIAEDIAENDLAQLAGKIQREMSEPVEIEDHRLVCHCSIGIVVLPDNAVTFDQAIMRADIAMYRAKQDGKNQYRFYDEAMESTILRRLTLQKAMSGNPADAGFFSQFQPIVDIDSGKIKGAEALARWDHPEFGFLSPIEFIPIAESTGYINNICHHMLENACELVASIVSGYPEFYVSVNISPVQLKDPRFCTDIFNIVSKHQLDSTHIKFEITESQMIESDADFDRVMEQLQEFGIALYLDDFGTGYSNLAHLQKMNFEVIKVDRSFVMDCDMDEKKLPLLKSIRSLSNELKINLVAEGVETDGEHGVLKRLGVGSAQGYLWSKPVSAVDFKRLL